MYTSTTLVIINIIVNKDEVLVNLKTKYGK